MGGAGRGSFNHRFGQASRDALQHFNFLFPVDMFPFTDAGHGVSCPAGPLSGVTMVTTSSAGGRGPGDGRVRRAGGAGRR